MTFVATFGGSESEDGSSGKGRAPRFPDFFPPASARVVGFVVLVFAGGPGGSESDSSGSGGGGFSFFVIKARGRGLVGAMACAFFWGVALPSFPFIPEMRGFVTGRTVGGELDLCGNEGGNVLNAKVDVEGAATRAGCEPGISSKSISIASARVEGRAGGDVLSFLAPYFLVIRVVALLRDLVA